MTFRLSFLALNFILITGLFFPGNSIGLYLSTLVPFLILINKNQGILKSNIALILIIIFLTNIFLQTLLGYPPNIKLMLNFLGNLIMIYTIVGLLVSEFDFVKYLDGLLKLQVAIGIFIVITGLLINGQNFFLINPNYIYVSIDQFLPLISAQKQVLAPFMFFSGIMAIKLLKPNNLLKNLGIYFFIISAIFMSLGSRSVILGIAVTTLIFIFRKYLSNIFITSILFTIVTIAIGTANIFLESYIDIIRLVDVRGVVYIEIVDEIIKNPFGIGYGNTISYLSQNNSALFSETSFYFDDLKDSNEAFAQFDFESFPINVESSILILALEQGIFIVGLLYIFFVTKIARMFLASKITVLYIIGFSVTFFTALTEDNFLLLPFLFYMALFLRANISRQK